MRATEGAASRFAKDGDIRLRTFLPTWGTAEPKAHPRPVRELGNYEPGNCRQATKKEQARNTRRNVRYEVDGISLTLPEWSERNGVPPRDYPEATASGPSHSGCCVEDASMVGHPRRVLEKLLPRVVNADLRIDRLSRHFPAFR